MDFRGHKIALPTKEEFKQPNADELAYMRLVAQYPGELIHRRGEECRVSGKANCTNGGLSKLLQSAFKFTGTHYIDIDELVPVVRENGSKYQEAKMLTENKIKTVCDLTEDFHVLADATKALYEMSVMTIPFYHDIDLTKRGNRLYYRYLTVSNLNSRALHQGTSIGDYGETSLDIWCDDIKYRDVTVSYDASENTRLNVEANLITYHSYVQSKVLADALMLSRKDVEKMTSGQRRKVEEKLRMANLTQDRSMRLLKAALTYIYLKYGGERNKFTISMRPGDTVGMYSLETLPTWAAMDNCAFVHCNKAENKQYIAFLYMIAAGYPFTTMETDAGYFSGSVWKMGPEADKIVVVCDTEPESNNINGTYGFTADEWIGYLNQYAQDMQLTSVLDNVFARAHILLYSDYLPACNVSYPISVVDLFRPCMVTETSAGKTIKMTLNERVVIGGMILASQVGLMVKELVSHQESTDLDLPYTQSMLQAIRDDYGLRGRLYSTFEKHYFGRGFNAIRGVDPLKVDNDQWYRLLDNVCARDLLWSKRISSSSLDRGFSQMATQCEWVPQNVYANMSGINRRSVSSLLSFSNILKNVRLDKATPIVKSNNWNVKRYGEMEGVLDAGKCKILRDGVSVGQQHTPTRKIRNFKEMVAPIEHKPIHDIDDTLDDNYDDTSSSMDDSDSYTSDNGDTKYDDIIEEEEEEDTNDDQKRKEEAAAAAEKEKKEQEEKIAAAENERKEKLRKQLEEAREKKRKLKEEKEKEREAMRIAEEKRQKDEKEKEEMRISKEKAKKEQERLEKEAAIKQEKVIKLAKKKRSTLELKLSEVESLRKKVEGWNNTLYSNEGSGSLRTMKLDDWSPRAEEIMNRIKSYHGQQHKKVRETCTPSISKKFGMYIPCMYCSEVMDEFILTEVQYNTYKKKPVAFKGDAAMYSVLQGLVRGGWYTEYKRDCSIMTNKIANISASNDETRMKVIRGGIAQLGVMLSETCCALLVDTDGGKVEYISKKNLVPFMKQCQKYNDITQTSNAIMHAIELMLMELHDKEMIHELRTVRDLIKTN